ncbi:hypothetical protein ABPG75_013170 [Micractinium tetrahymenae]
MGEPGVPAGAGVPQSGTLESSNGTIAGADRLQHFASLPAVERRTLDASLRGVLAETALTGLQRYEWRLLAPLLHSLVDAVLADYGRQDAEVEGPPRPPPAGFESVDALAARLHALLDGHEAAPFTLQRLCEVLLEPRRQYARLDKVALAIEKLLMVTSTRRPDAQLPPPPVLAMLGGVNLNPKSPYLLDGRPPQVLDPQQHQARLQQQAQAMAAAQQHLRQQHEQQEGRLGLPNGLEQGGPGPHMEAASGQPAGAAADAAAAAGEALAAAEAMQLEAAAFVESALADSTNGGSSGGDAGDGSGREGSPTTAAADGSSGQGAAAAGSPAVPPTPPDQQLPSPQQQEQQQSLARDAAAGARPAESPDASGPASMDIDATAPEQQQEAQAHPPAEAQTQVEAPDSRAASATPPGPESGDGAAAEPQHGEQQQQS